MNECLLQWREKEKTSQLNHRVWRELAAFAQLSEELSPAGGTAIKSYLQSINETDRDAKLLIDELRRKGVAFPASLGDIPQLTKEMTERLEDRRRQTASLQARQQSLINEQDEQMRELRQRLAQVSPGTSFATPMRLSCDTTRRLDMSVTLGPHSPVGRGETQQPQALGATDASPMAFQAFSTQFNAPTFDGSSGISWSNFIQQFETYCQVTGCRGETRRDMLLLFTLKGRASSVGNAIMQAYAHENGGQSAPYEHVKERMHKAFRPLADSEADMEAFEKISMQDPGESFQTFSIRFTEAEVKAQQSRGETKQSPYTEADVRKFYFNALPADIQGDIQKQCVWKQTPLTLIKAKAEQLHGNTCRTVPTENRGTKRTGQGSLPLAPAKRAQTESWTQEEFREQLKATVREAMSSTAATSNEETRSVLRDALKTWIPAAMASNAPPPPPTAQGQGEHKGECYGFQKGNCRWGSACRFSHGPLASSNPMQQRETQTCKQFSAHGSCSYGGRCKFTHNEGGIQRPQPVAATQHTHGAAPLVCELCSKMGHEWYQCKDVCGACGGPHRMHTCQVRASATPCPICKRVGHLSRMCRTARRESPTTHRQEQGNSVFTPARQAHMMHPERAQQMQQSPVRQEGEGDTFSTALLALANALKSEPEQKNE